MIHYDNIDRFFYSFSPSLPVRFESSDKAIDVAVITFPFFPFLSINHAQFQLALNSASLSSGAMEILRASHSI